MRHYKHRIKIQATLDEVVEFHNNSQGLKKLTPPPIIVQFNRIDPLGENSIADFTMWIGPIPVRWVAIHTNVNRLSGFTDTQTSGPFKYWRHRHSFILIDEKTSEILDEIEAEPGHGIFKRLLSEFMWLNLPILFAYRGWVTRRTLE
jgi:ligand-binding SRPBCC domain-containing protein